VLLVLAGFAVAGFMESGSRVVSIFVFRFSHFYFFRFSHFYLFFCSYSCSIRKKENRI